MYRNNVGISFDEIWDMLFWFNDYLMNKSSVRWIFWNDINFFSDIVRKEINI